MNAEQTNIEKRIERIRRYAQNRYEIRVKYGIEGSAEDDWKRAERLVDYDDTHTDNSQHTLS